MKISHAAKEKAHFHTEVFRPRVQKALESGELSEEMRGYLREALRIVEAPQPEVRPYGQAMLAEVLTVILLEQSLSNEQLLELPNVGPETLRRIREAGEGNG